MSNRKLPPINSRVLHEDQAIEFNNSINSPERQRSLREDENQITKEHILVRNIWEWELGY